MADERAQRRLAAILAADVVGYSRLIGADEEGTLARLKAHRRDLFDPKIGEYRGRIVKTTGDGLLAEFASVIDALRCAVEVQRSMGECNAIIPPEQRIEFRLGINVGDIVIDAGDIYGDGVNVAARLEALAEPGGICVSSRVQEDARGKLDLAFDDLGEQRLKNIAWPVRVYRVRLDGKAETSQPALALPDKPSIAVLPFTNMNGDPEQVYFSDGVTEDIITGLSRFRSLFVIARHSSFVFRTEPTDVAKVAQRLGVQYVVEGSVRTAGNRIRIAVQLIDAAKGSHLWAERYDRGLEDIFAVQDDVVQTVVAAIAGRVELAGVEIARRKSPHDMRAYDYWLRGKRALDLSNLEATEEALSFFKEALKIDPDYARGFAGLAEATYSRAFFVPLPKAFGELVNESLAFAERSVALDDADARPHMVLAWACMFRHEFDRARRHFDLSNFLNPNEADLIMHRAGALALLGEAGDAVALADDAIRLTPLHPEWYLEYVCLINFAARRYEAVLATAATARDAYPSSPAWRAAASAYLGRYEDARFHTHSLMAALRGRWDGQSGASFEEHAEYLCRVIPFKRLDDAEHLLEGLRRAAHFAS
jgi:adenylate cyclase